MNDYMMSLFSKHNKQFRDILNNQQENNQREFDLALMMNKVLNSGTMKKLQELLDSNYIHKLTYRKNWKNKVNGKKTVYDYVLFFDKDR